MLTVRFSDHFRQRRSEWMLAIAMAMVGLAYLAIDGLFIAPYFTTMLAVMPQAAWGLLVTGLAAMRLIMLFINGRWRVSPYFRAAGGIAGAGLWMMLFTSAITSVALVQSVGLWLLFFAFDVIAVSDAAADARAAHDRKKEEGGSVLRPGLADARPR